MRNNKTLVMALMLVLTVVVLGSGVTYAYFQASISGNETASTITVSGGTISFTFSGGSNVSASNVVPGWNATKYVSVTASNNTGKSLSYNLNLIVDYNTFTSSTAYLQYQVYTCTSSTTSTCTTSVVDATNFTWAAGSTVHTLYTATGITTGTQYYAVKFIFPNLSSNQDQGKAFAAHMTISSSTQVSQ